MISRSILAGVLAAAGLCAAPQPLTTIQDTLYKADGTRFNGTLKIAWGSFEAIDQSQILQQTSTVTVVDGNLRVQLVPSTTATPLAFYTVTYNSDGHIQFQETWSVPSSATPLRVRDVRIATPGSAEALAADTTQVQETDVVGLIADLGARPLKGPAYSPGRVAWVNPTGALETVTGSPADCVRVDGTSGPCGGTQPAFNDNETPGGVVDGANAAFVLAKTPNPGGSLVLYRNGVLQKAGQDYSLAGNSIQFVAAAVPQPGDTLAASYRVNATGTDLNQLYPNPQVLCSGLGASTTSATLASLGLCVIPGGFLSAGDRIEVHFDLEHQGNAGAYSFELHWGDSTLLQRDAAVSDSLATGRAELGLKLSGAQVSYQTWGSVLPFAAGVGTAADDYFSSGVVIDFRARVTTGDTLTLRSFSVVRVP